MAKRKTTARKTSSRKPASRKPGTRKSATRKSATRKSATRKSATRKATAGKPAAAKTTAGKSKASRGSKRDKPADGKVRLQKLLASHGLGSRRGCEEYILEGRVTVDGKVVNKLGTRVDPHEQKITFDGERVVEQKLQYFMLNKPPGVVSTVSDPSGRLRVIDLIKTESRVYNVGRLDKSSEGLILVTNDGELANRLTHPRYGVEKKYHVLVRGCPSREKLTSLKQGIYLAEARVQVSNVRIKKRLRDATWLEIILDEGRNREIRRILARIGHKVVQLKRVSIGPLQLGDLPTGTHRQLLANEIRVLKKATATTKKPKKKIVKKKKSVARKKPTRKSPGRKKGTVSRSSTSASGRPRRGAGKNKPVRVTGRRTRTKR